MHASTPAALIRRLTIERFRGIERLVWYPKPGVNVIVGGGDVGKTTVLDAIALLFHPTNTTVFSDADYWRREVEDGFCIEAVMSLPETCGISQQTKNAWPWEWSGTEPELPKIDQDPAATNVAEPVFRLRVRGTPDFDLSFEILQPDDTATHLSVVVRRKIGLVRLSGDDRNDRDLRLVLGSALDRLISDKTLRSRMGQKLGGSDLNDELKDDAKTQLSNLDMAFKQQSLPTGLGLGLTGGPGLSLNALIGLTANKESVNLPLASWGAGTRRLAALEIAAAQQGESPIILVDEVERGLEPYHQRRLMAKLQTGGSQVFLTTHSAAALSAAGNATIWHMGSDGKIGELPDSVAAHLRRDPETFLARIAIIAEGPTEVGFVTVLLQKAIDNDLLDLGIWITDGRGNDNTLKLLEGLVDSGLTFAGFADDEERDPEKWERVKKELGALLFRWPSGCIEENIIKLVPPDRLEEFIKDPDGDSGERRGTLAGRLGITGNEFSAIRAKASDLTALIIEAATGTVPEGSQSADSGDKKTLRKHGRHWFKSYDGGRELASKVFTFDLWPTLKTELMPFLNAVRGKVSLPEIDELPS
ncbi:MAG: ATP-binding protein [Planctomycetes bacterium]|nr:ATP-binding protein [Planctomycetota bacterium]